MTFPQHLSPSGSLNRHDQELQAPISGVVFGPNDYPVPPPHVVEILRTKVYGRTTARDALWEFFKDFLLSRGYALAPDGDRRHASDDLPPAANPFFPLSGESYTAAVRGRQGARWAGPTFWPTLAGAYDSEDRFVVIKIVERCDSELTILKLLDDDRNNPWNRTIPVLDYIEAGKYVFVVMPSWELNLGNVHPCWVPVEFLDCAFQCLQGLAYMHNRNIAHLDVFGLNIVLNHVCHCREDKNQPFFSLFNYQFAYIDFGCSVQLTDESKLIQASKAPITYRGIPGVPTEDNGLFDPRPADVYALARTFRTQIINDSSWCERVWNEGGAGARLVDEAPEYLALLDSMMAADPSARPTAAQALAQLATIRGGLSPEASARL